MYASTARDDAGKPTLGTPFSTNRLLRDHEVDGGAVHQLVAVGAPW